MFESIRRLRLVWVELMLPFLPGLRFFLLLLPSYNFFHVQDVLAPDLLFGGRLSIAWWDFKTERRLVLIGPIILQEAVKVSLQLCASVLLVSLAQAEIFFSISVGPRSLKCRGIA